MLTVQLFLQLLCRLFRRLAVHLIVAERLRLLRLALLLIFKLKFRVVERRIQRFLSCCRTLLFACHIIGARLSDPLCVLGFHTVDTFRAGLVIAEQCIITTVRIPTEHFTHVSAVCRADHVILLDFRHNSAGLHSLLIQLCVQLTNFVHQLITALHFGHREPPVSLIELLQFRPSIVQPVLQVDNIILRLSIHLLHRLYSRTLIERSVFLLLQVLCCLGLFLQIKMILQIRVIIRSQLSTPCRILPLHIGQRVYHLILRGLHRTFPNWSFRQLKRRLQLAVELYKLLHLIVIIRISGIHTLRICCRSRTDRTRRAEHQTAERAACGALGKLLQAELCVRILRRLIRNVVEEIACAFLCRLLTHLDEDIFYGIHAAGVQNLAHLTEWQSFGCRLDRTRGQTARQRLPRTLALLIQFKRALTGRLAAHHDRADRRTDDRNRTCRHHRRIARKGNALFGQPARRRR